LKRTEAVCNDGTDGEKTDLLESSDKLITGQQPADQSNNDSQTAMVPPSAAATATDRKTDPDNNSAAAPKRQPLLPKTRALCTDMKAVNHPADQTTNGINLASLSAALTDDDNKGTVEETGPLNDDTAAVSSYSDCEPPDTSSSSCSSSRWSICKFPDRFYRFAEISSPSETDTTKESATGGATVKPAVTTAVTMYNSQAAKYYRGRPIHSQSRTMRDGHINNSFNR